MKFLFVLALSINVAWSMDNFATKTSYKASLEIDSTETFFQTFPIPETCAPAKYVSGLYRHGIAQPSKSVVKEALDELKTKDQAGTDLLAKLQEVLSQFPSAKQKTLSETGKKEFEEIGRKLKERHPSLFEGLKGNDFEFYLTAESRYHDSFRSFVKGFGLTEEPFPTEDESLMAFYKACQKYIKDVDDKDVGENEQSAFMDQKIGFLNEELRKKYESYFEPYTFTKDQVKALYKLAGSELAILGTRQFQETFLSEEAVNVLEYAVDLKKYWKSYGGEEITKMQSCGLLKHIFGRMDRAIDEASGSVSKGTFYFGHAKTLLSTLSLLGLFKDVPTVDSYNSMKSRDFKSTRLIPFSGNIRFELLECDGVLNIALYMKDSQLKWPACDSSVCPYATVKAYYQDIIDKCDFDTICENKKD